MLVDLGRNDLGRVCAPDTVSVVDFMSVERYSHVMHLVSTVVGTLADGGRPTTRWPRPSRPAPSPARPSPGRWRSSTSSSRCGAACTAGSSGYFDFAGQPRRGHRDPDRTHQGRHGPRAGRRRAGRRLGARGGGRRVREQGRRRAACRGCGTDPRPVTDQTPGRCRPQRRATPARIRSGPADTGGGRSRLSSSPTACPGARCRAPRCRGRGSHAIGTFTGRDMFPAAGVHRGGCASPASRESSPPEAGAASSSPSRRRSASAGRWRPRPLPSRHLLRRSSTRPSTPGRPGVASASSRLAPFGGSQRSSGACVSAGASAWTVVRGRGWPVARIALRAHRGRAGGRSAHGRHRTWGGIRPTIWLNDGHVAALARTGPPR